MEKWSKPQIVDLATQYTEAGGLGGQSDGVFIDVVFHGNNFILIGTSGPALPNPLVRP